MRASGPLDQMTAVLQSEADRRVIARLWRLPVGRLCAVELGLVALGVREARSPSLAGGPRSGRARP